jgi:SAM-dependent methyltransferase
MSHPRKTGRVISDDDRWNHNIHYHSVIHRALSDRCQSALDVGCGEGLLARQLRRHVPHVVGIDVDEPSIRLAERQNPSHDIRYLLGDFLTFPFELASFDAVTSVATLHHVDAAAGLQRMADLLAPGGTLALLGLARNRFPRDLPREVAAVVAHRLYAMRYEYWEHTAPTVWPPPLTFTQMRDLVATLLPGADFRRHALWRYSIVWTRPL